MSRRLTTGLGLGFSDATGANDYPRVDRIGEDSPAALTGQFSKGDKIKAVNNYHVKGKKRTFLYDIVKKGGSTGEQEDPGNGCGSGSVRASVGIGRHPWAELPGPGWWWWW